MMSPKQQKILELLQTRMSMTAAEIALEVGSETKATSKHLRLLEAMGQIYVCEWRKGKHGVMTKAYKAGCEESVVLERKRKKKGMSQDEARKAFTIRNSYDPAAPVVVNTGWVSTIHSKDYSMNHAEHIRFMTRFKPHPDHASSWLFNEPKVELLGAKYDLLQA